MEERKTRKFFKAFQWCYLFLGIFTSCASGVLLNTDSLILTREFSKSKTIFSIIGILVGALILSSAVLAIFGISKRKRALFIVNTSINGFLLICLVPYIVLAAQYLNRYSTDVNNFDGCSSFDDFSELNKCVNNAAALFCSYDCPCKVDDTTDLPEETRMMIITNNLTGAERVQDCKLFQEKLGMYSQFFGALEAAESEENCSGFCIKNSYHIFININSGLPDDKCATNLLNGLKLAFLAMMIGCAIIQALLTASVLVSFYIFIKHKGATGGNDTLYHYLYEIKED